MTSRNEYARVGQEIRQMVDDFDRITEILAGVGTFYTNDEALALHSIVTSTSSKRLIDVPQTGKKEIVMSEFKVGDKVRVIRPSDVRLLDRDVFTVDGVNASGWLNLLEDEGGYWNCDRFELVQPEPPAEATANTAGPAPFKVGDRVKVVRPSGVRLPEGSVFTVQRINSQNQLDLAEDEGGCWDSYRFELVQPEPSAETTADTVMIQVDRKAELERIEAVHGHLVDNTCKVIRRYADEYHLNFCDEGLESFCNEVGIEFTVADVKRRAVIYLDLTPAPFEDQKALLEQLMPHTGDGVDWRQACIDTDNEGGETEWSGFPLTEGTDGLHPI